MQQIIEITQDAAGIINEQTSAEYQGLYTSGLETCVALAIKGTQGVMLIHHSGRLDINSINDILGEIGEVQSVLMFANQQRRNKRNITIIKHQNQILFPNINIPEVILIDSGAVSINRDFTWNSNPIAVANLVRPLEREQRLLTNKLNNLIADGLEVDVQFNGEHLTPCTELCEPMEQIMFRWQFEPDYTDEQREILRDAINFYQRHLGLAEIPSIQSFNFGFFEQIALLTQQLGLNEEDEKSAGPDLSNAP